MFRNLYSFHVLAFVVAAAFAAVQPSYVSANVLVNGDFEDTSGTFPNGWFTRNTNTSSIHAGLTLGSTTAAYLAPGTDGNINQMFTGPADWIFEFDFLASDPGAGSRNLNFAVAHGMSYPPFTTNGTLNIRLVTGGTFETLDFTQSPVWQPVLTNAVQFSVDNEIDGDFSGPNDVANLHHIKMVGHYSSVTPTWDIFVTDSNNVTHSALGLSFFAEGSFGPGATDPVPGLGPNGVIFNTGSFTVGGAVIDNVSLTAVPEPASLVLMGMGTLLLRRRRIGLH